jgi:hypothetical protein
MTSQAKPKAKLKAKKPSLKKLQKDIVGTWRLISAEDRASSSDPWVPGTFGIPPSGYFIYDATGHASVQNHDHAAAENFVRPATGKPGARNLQ